MRVLISKEWLGGTRITVVPAPRSGRKVVVLRRVTRDRLKDQVLRAIEGEAPGAGEEVWAAAV